MGNLSCKQAAEMEFNSNLEQEKNENKIKYNDNIVKENKIFSWRDVKACKFYCYI